ncbi:hypothetical protein J6590_079902 [Homalodisca vitripennis]|nr:hypothetical protein J6590_079902 [Homalodisca vitripennis]
MDSREDIEASTAEHNGDQLLVWSVTSWGQLEKAASPTASLKLELAEWRLGAIDSGSDYMIYSITVIPVY